MGNLFTVDGIDRTVMATSSDPPVRVDASTREDAVGMAHYTVVPENFDPDPGE